MADLHYTLRLVLYSKFYGNILIRSHFCCFRRCLLFFNKGYLLLSLPAYAFQSAHPSRNLIEKSATTTIHMSVILVCYFSRSAYSEEGHMLPSMVFVVGSGSVIIIQYGLAQWPSTCSERLSSPSTDRYSFHIRN